MSDQPPSPPDGTDAEYPSAYGILQCLRMLTDEATSLQLAGTVDALRAAIAVCVAECRPEPVLIGPPAGAVLH
ncbi:MAG: hypothetical protein M0Z28_14505 [Rhodospirillales bacterium]|nr:hypothetical protein [Rhodospirillales bacterium]